MIGSQRSTPKDVMPQEAINPGACCPLMENIIYRKAELVPFMNIIHINDFNSLSY